MSQDFLTLGLDHLLLTQLSSIWEAKLVQMNVATFDSVARPDHQPAILTQQHHFQLPQQHFQSNDNSFQFFENNPQLFTNQQIQQLSNHPAAAAGFPMLNPHQQTMQSQFDQQQLNQQQNQQLNFRINQNDGADEEQTPFSSSSLSKSSSNSIQNKPRKEPLKTRQEIDKLLISQLDGNNDDSEEEESEEETNNPKAGFPNLGSDLDSDEDSESDDEKVDNLILCQYEKVTRIKNKWKCVLRDGVVHLEGKDYLFNKV